MAQISVTINGRNYPVACNAGEEERIAALAHYIDDKVKGFAHDLGAVGEARLLVLAALMLADELAEANEALHGGSHGGNGATNGASDEAVMAPGVERLAQRIEAIAAKLETPHI